MAKGIGGGRSRNDDGQLRAKRGDTRVRSLRETYGDDFAAGRRSDMKLSTLLKESGSSSLSDYLKNK